VALNAHIDECLTKQYLDETQPVAQKEDDTIALMDAELALALSAAEPVVVEPSPPSPSLLCPYPGCSQRMETFEFPNHVFQTHAACNQQLSCPICYLETGESYSVTQNTNLLDHLRKAHADTAEFQRALLESRNSYLRCSRVELPTEVGKNYTIQTLSKSLEKECSICFEEFEQGHKVAWMDCLCVFHEKCLEEWFTKTKDKCCPVHREEKD